MLNVTKRFLRQTAVYWAPLGPTKTGQQSYDTPIELPVRWEDKQQTIIDPKGNTTISRAEVMVGGNVAQLGVLWLGTIADLVSATNPFAQANAYKIQTTGSVPNLFGVGGDYGVRLAYL